MRTGWGVCAREGIGKEEQTHEETGVRRVMGVHEEKFGLDDDAGLCGGYELG